MGLASAGSFSALLLGLLASPSTAQDLGDQRAPAVRVYSQNGPGVVSNYVTPAIEVSEDAYVFAVMMDVDGRIQVLHPEFPGISVRIRSQSQLRLPNFFAGYNEPSQGSAYYSSSSGSVAYDRSDALRNDARGTVIALASRAPFNFARIAAGGDWNGSAIRDLIEYRTPAAAARALAQYLGAGEPIGSDYMRFAGGREGYYAYNGYSSCGYDNNRSLRSGFIDGRAFNRSARQRSLNRGPVVVGYDACGFPVVVAAPFRPRGKGGNPAPRQPKENNPAFPKSRFPDRIGRNTDNGDAAPQPVAAEGIFPLSERAKSQMRDPANAAPATRRAEPREIPGQFRSRSERVSLREQDRVPAERTAPRRAESAPIGTQPIHRSEPRVIWSSPQPRAQSAPQSRPEPARNPPRR
jgi:hypothetical protein